MDYYFLDTSALLEGALQKYNKIYTSPLVLSELEHIKNSFNKDEAVKYKTRKAIRDIIDSNNISYTFYPQKKIDHLIKKYNFLTNINDHYILCEAELLGIEVKHSVTFITCDGALYLFAQQLPHIQAIYFEKNKYEKDEYCGWIDCHPTDLQLVELYSHPSHNVFNAKTNQFVKIFENNELKDVQFWNGQQHRKLNYKDIKSVYLNATIKPKNLEQKMAFDLLQNKDIPVKLLYGVPGSGKDYLMITHAMDLIQKGEFDKIIFIRNLVPFKDAPEIGFLAGSLQEKIEWGLGPITSILGEEGLKIAEEQGIIEAVNLGFIRGCSWDKTIIYVSEGQNITGGGYKLLVSRCGKNSQLWINGDILQTDNKMFEKNNGITRLIDSLSGNELFGAIKFNKTERSKTAELASII